MQIKVNNIKKVYSPKTPFEYKALDGVSYEFEKGKLYAIVGKTGSGKSTLVQHLNALLKPTDGEVIIDNRTINNQTKKIKNVNEIRSKVGLVFQFPEYQLFESTILKDVMFGPKKLGQTEEEAEKNSIAALKAVNISEDLFERSPFELSGGQKRRVAIAGIISIQTDVIIFDEPTAGLDPVGEKDINELIVSLKEQGKCVIVVTHNLTHVLEIADEVLIMNDAKLKHSDTKEKVFDKPSILNDLELEIPLITKLIEELKTKGFKIPSNITSKEALIAFLDKNLKKKGK